MKDNDKNIKPKNEFESMILNSFSLSFTKSNSKFLKFVY
jgi:hypothetical protein